MDPHVIVCIVLCGKDSQVPPDREEKVVLKRACDEGSPST